MTELLELIGTGDSYAVIEHLQRMGTPTEIAERYHSIVRELYWKAHHLPAVVLVSRAGIIYCLGQSLARDTPFEMIEPMRSSAKALAYDAGSFTWPGWEEPGICPTSAEIAFGRDCARLNLRLAVELRKPPKGISKAQWLIGAHALISREFELAEESFQKAHDVLAEIDAETEAMKLCNTGFLAIARLCRTSSDVAARNLFETAMAELDARIGDDAKAYSSQLAAMRRQFVAR